MCNNYFVVIVSSINFASSFLVYPCFMRNHIMQSFYKDQNYRKNSKNWDTWNNYHNCPTIGTVGFYSAVLCSKDANGITNREDPDQTAPWGAVWSGSALFAQTYLSQYLKLLRYWYNKILVVFSSLVQKYRELLLSLGGQCGHHILKF